VDGRSTYYEIGRQQALSPPVAPVAARAGLEPGEAHGRDAAPQRRQAEPGRLAAVEAAGLAVTALRSCATAPA